MLTTTHSITSHRFCCRHCRSDVALELQGGGLYYQCQNSRCQWACEVDCVEALGIKEPEPTPPATPAARKALYYQAQGVMPIAQGRGYLVPSASRNVVHYVQNGRCSCEASQAGRECWHTALVALQSRKVAA